MLSMMALLTLFSCSFNTQGITAKRQGDGFYEENSPDIVNNTWREAGPPIGWDIGGNVGTDWGTNYCNDSDCPMGCNKVLNRCYRLQPSNFNVDTFFSTVTANIAGEDDSIIINTDTGAISAGDKIYRQPGSTGTVDSNGIYWGVVKQGTGYPELSVFGVSSFQLPYYAGVQITGKRAFALYATHQITIDGIMTAGASGSQPGAGGFAGGGKNGEAGQACFNGQGQGGGSDSSVINQPQGGGGGGGRKSPGGAGASSTESSKPPGGSGGSPNGNESLIPLYGGCGGGAGGGPDTSYGTGNGGYGGSGGGAIQLACNGKITINGVINAPGGGGEGGHYGAGGGGGGSGGAILIEGIMVQVDGLVTANGGGGGSGAALNISENAPNGESGKASLISASGGAYNPTYGGAGGNGGARDKEDGSPGGANANSGGGGGAVGRIRFNALQTNIGTDKTSPVPSTSNIVGKW
jgi:hypothetical protein